MYWGQYDAHTVKKWSKATRDMHCEFTNKNLELRYGKGDGN